MLGEQIKKLGFGLMRLPKFDDGTFDIEQIKQMVDEFLAAGFTYFDTAWAYAGSEDMRFGRHWSSVIRARNSNWRRRMRRGSIARRAKMQSINSTLH